MKFRAAASIALAAAVAAGLAGCNMISEQRTTTSYSASDGVAVSVGDFELRNLMVLTDGESFETTTGSLVGAVVNHSGDAGSISISAGSARAQVAVPSESGLVPIGYNDGEQVMLTGAKLQVGGTVELTFTAGGGSTVTAHVPVLDGTLAEYSTLVPTTPATQAPATPGTTATPGATETPATPAETEPTA